MEIYRQKFRKCVVPACNGLYSLRYTFPKSNPKLFNKWLQQVSNKILENKSVDEIYKSYVVCDLHFPENFKVPWSKRGLTRNAYPTLFLPPQACTAPSNVPLSVSSTNGNISSNPSEEGITNPNMLPSKTTLSRVAHEPKKARLSPSVDITELDILNLTQICRTCKCETQDMQSIFVRCDSDNSNKSTSIDKMLMACASVQVTEGDGLPSKICKTCMEQLKTAYQFKWRCEEVDADLKKYAVYLRDKEIRDKLLNCNSLESSNDSQKDSNHETSIPPISPNPATEPNPILDTDQTLATNDSESVYLSSLFKCRKCDKECITLRHLQTHEESHSRNTLYVCKICKKTQPTADHIKRHMVTHLKNYKSKPFSCNKCNRVFNKAAHCERHGRRCNGRKVYPCHTCNRIFRRRNNLEIHKKVHDKQPNLCILENLYNVEEYYYQRVCEIYQDTENSDVGDCSESKMLASESEDDDDENSVGDIKSVKYEQNDISEISLVSEDVGDYMSVKYEQSNISKSCLVGEDGNENNEENNYDASLGEWELNLENEVGKSANIKEENVFESTDNIMEDGDNASDFVNDALATYNNSSDLQYVPRKSVSPKIEQIFLEIPNNIDLSEVKNENESHDPAVVTVVDNKHTENEDVASQIYKCKLCDKEIKKLQNFRRHVANHSAREQFSCKWCGKSFMHSDKLKQHLKMHTNGKGLNCEHCHKVFYRPEQLEKHKSSVHNEDKIIHQKKFECSVCFKSFSTERYRETHEESHNMDKEFPCNVCGMTFTSQRQLSEHSVFHKEVKKFFCLECGKRFAKNAHLVVHMHQHRGEKPYICKDCGKGFLRLKHLVDHEQCHTGEKNHLCTVCGTGFDRCEHWPQPSHTGHSEKCSQASSDHYNNIAVSV